MPNNLGVSIGGDTSKLRADLALAQSALRATNAEIKSLADTAQKLGGAGKSAIAAPLQEMTRKAEGLERQIKSLNKSIKGTTSAVNDFHAAAHPRKFYLVENSLKTLNGGFMAIGHNILGAQGAIAGFAVGMGLRAVLEQFKELEKSLREIRDISRETGTKPLVVQGMQELAKEAGESADSANKFLAGMGATLTKVATQTRDMQTGVSAAGAAAEAAGQNFATFGNQVVEVNRGGVQAVRDFSDSLAIMQVKEDKLVKLPIDQQQKTLAEAFLRTEANAKRLGLTELQLNAISKDVFGVPAAEADKLARAFLNMAAKNEELANSQRGATQKNLENIDQVAAAQEKLAQQMQESTARASNATAAARADQIKGFADMLAAADKTLSNLPKIFEDTFKVPANSLVDPTFQPFEPLKEQANTLPPFFDDIGKKIKGSFGEPFADPTFHPFQPLKDDANTLPPFFEGLTTTIGNIWKGFFSLLISDAKAATLGVEKSMAQIQADAQKADAVLKDVVVSASKLPTVGRGPGTGDTGGYGPASRGGAGYGPGSSTTQSILPGTSDYQAPPPKMVSFTGVERGLQYSKSAAESAADAAAASQSAAEASASAVNSWVDPAFSGYAEGGMVHGPGTPTSDSVTARLSAGEFVMRAAAVQRWGPAFMQALNGMSGRMPSRGIPSFAGGGMVTAGGGGTPVHLHLGGHSFALSGDGGVVSALVTEAHRHQTRSAGAKPSWYGGTPGR